MKIVSSFVAAVMCLAFTQVSNQEAYTKYKEKAEYQKEVAEGVVKGCAGFVDGYNEDIVKMIATIDSTVWIFAKNRKEALAWVGVCRDYRDTAKAYVNTAKNGLANADKAFKAAEDMAKAKPFDYSEAIDKLELAISGYKNAAKIAGRSPGVLSDFIKARIRVYEICGSK